MTEMRGSDDRLREAFQALGESSVAELPEELLDRIWRAVSGELPAADREALVDRMATDPACAEAWRVAHELWQASRPAGRMAPVQQPGAIRWTPSWLAAAAVLLLGTTIGVVSLLNRPGGDEFRASPGLVVESLVPADARLPRDAFHLRWTPGPDGSRYQLRVTTEDLRVLATATDLTTAEFTVDRDALSAVASGGRVLWQVDVQVPGGGRLASRTFVTGVR